MSLGNKGEISLFHHTSGNSSNILNAINMQKIQK